MDAKVSTKTKTKSVPVQLLVGEQNAYFSK